jgi:hypothetical protein
VDVRFDVTKLDLSKVTVPEPGDCTFTAGVADCPVPTAAIPSPGSTVDLSLSDAAARTLARKATLALPKSFHRLTEAQMAAVEVDPSDNTDGFAVLVAGRPGGGTGGSGGGTGEGGGLPITGPVAASVAGAGAVLVAIGAGATARTRPMVVVLNATGSGGMVTIPPLLRPALGGRRLRDSAQSNVHSHAAGRATSLVSTIWRLSCCACGSLVATAWTSRTTSPISPTMTNSLNTSS